MSVLALTRSKLLEVRLIFSLLGGMLMWSFSDLLLPNVVDFNHCWRFERLGVASRGTEPRGRCRILGSGLGRRMDDAGDPETRPGVRVSGLDAT